MDIDVLRLFLDVARFGGFAAAARARDLDPSTVSRAVADLEQEIGARLFQRTTRRLSLTEAGETYLRRVEAVIDELDLAREEAVGHGSRLTGALRLSASVAFGQVCLVPMLAKFRAAFPELTLELILTDANLDLVRDRIDLAIRLAPAIEGALICAKLRDTRYRVCASPDYLAAAPRLERPSDLVAHQALLFALPEFRRRWLFRGGAGKLTEIDVDGKIISSSALALREAAVSGLGPALLADWLIEADLAAGRLVDLFPGYAATATSFETAAWIVYPSRAFLPSKVRRSIDFLRAHLGR